MTDFPARRIGPVSGEAMRVWSRALRDDNPIHLDREAAAALGYGPRRVNPGPANLAYLIDAAMAAFPDHDVATVEAVFLGNVLEDDQLVAQGNADAADAAAVTATLVRADDGAPLVSARITLA